MKKVNKDLDIETTDNADIVVNEELYNKALETLNSFGLEWTHRSIDFVLNKENISFGQLRSCVYSIDGSAVFNYSRSVKTLIKAGLIGSKQFNSTQTNELEDKAYDIMEKWRDSFGGYLGTLHLLIINQMETKHFFMDSQDMAVIKHLSSKNLQKDLGTNLVREDLEEKVKQAQALSTIV